MMMKKAILGFALLSLCGFATAEESKSKGFYLGAAAGLSIFDDGGAAGGAAFDDEDTSLQFELGYKILKHFAVEGHYVQFGTFDTVLEVEAISVHAVGIIPFGVSGWELFGNVGVGTVNLQVSGLLDQDEDAIGFGVGVRYSPAENFSFAIQTGGYIFEADDGTGTIYDMSVGGTQLSAQFIF
jgi:Outer membrane protein beta-barrel domain